MNKYLRLLVDKQYRFPLMCAKGFYKRVPDKKIIEKKYRLIFGRKPNFESPETFNEKLQWLKLYDRNPLYTTMVDKYEVKKYVADIIGEEYIIPTINVWEKFEDIDFNSLPKQFVLKCTHNSGGVVICKDKSKLDIEKARKKLNKALKMNYFWGNREYPYKDVKPRIIAEVYMEDEKSGELPDYKYFCFGGEAKVMFIASERLSQEETKFDFYDMDFNHLPFTNGHPNSNKKIEKPEKFDEMKALAEKLSKGIPQVRVDFYEVNGKIYFGELTFFHWSGMKPFNPPEWDKKLGEYIILPKK